MIASNGKKLGIWMTTSLVLGNMIGSGIFLLPSVLAPYGGISIIGWLVTTLGAMAFALVFSQLSQAYPNTGGLYIYCKKEFGEAVGFLLAWCYWLSICIGTAAIVSSFTSYSTYFLPILKNNNIYGAIYSLVTIWLLTFVNARSVYSGGILQLVTTILKILPILLISFFGLFKLNLDHFVPFNAANLNNLSISSSINNSGMISNLEAIFITSSLTLWAFLGLESASIPAGSINNPKRTITIATILGTLIASVIYITSYTSILGLIDHNTLQASEAPFTVAANILWGDFGAFLIGIGACIACLGAVNGWVLIQGQMAYAIADDNLLPKFLSKKSKLGAPSSALITSSIITSSVLIFNSSDKLITIFKIALELSTITTLLTFLFCTGARLTLLSKSHSTLHTKHKFTVAAICMVAFIYGLVALASYNPEIVTWSLIVLMCGLPVYAWVKANIKN